jgi:hypothetical protein
VRRDPGSAARAEDAAIKTGTRPQTAEGGKAMIANPHITTHAIKRVLAWQIEKSMKGLGITKVEMAKRMKIQPRAVRSATGPD